LYIKKQKIDGKLSQVHLTLANKLGTIWIVMEYLLYNKLKKEIEIKYADFLNWSVYQMCSNDTLIFILNVQCSVKKDKIFYYINPQKLHMLQSLFCLTTALHISGITTTHLQEHKQL
jgi:hypothetical protein